MELVILFVLGVAALLGIASMAGVGKARRSARRKLAHHPHPKCGDCGKNSSVVHCVRHAALLCVGCMFRHDDGERCLYIPDSDKRKARGFSAGG